MNKNLIKYFNFNETTRSDNCISSVHRGWSGLLIIKLKISKGSIVDNTYIQNNFFEISNKEKILTVISGKLEVTFDNKAQKIMEEYDSVSFSSDQKKYTFICEKDTVAFIVASTDVEDSKHLDLVFFNFKKDIQIIDLWGGKIISRPYEGKKLNFFLFEIKEGFKFDDPGHLNEQITWLIKGSMNFYVGDIKKTLLPNDGVDVGPHEKHGGISDGAIGFDAFYPKREEKKYKNNPVDKVKRSIKAYGYTKTFFRILKYPFRK